MAADVPNGEQPFIVCWRVAKCSARVTQPVSTGPLIPVEGKLACHGMRRPGGFCNGFVIQWEKSTGTVMPSSNVRVVPPRTTSRSLVCP